MSSKKSKKTSNKKNKYYEKIDLIRAMSCIAILLYHMNILKGGYLAVCTFFTLSGYLAVISAFKKEKISLKDYYLNKLKRIYLPLLLVVFITIAITSFISNINWFNLKPETISVIFGYNNFWQLSANLDYFTRHINSPFTHLWYMGVIIEFYLIFPFLFLLLKKIGDKTKKYFPCIILGILSITSYILFYKNILDGNIMSSYYNTFTRGFSLLLGMLLAFIHKYYHSLISKKIKDKKIYEIIYYSYILVQIILLFLIDEKSPFFGISMLITTLITTRLIEYSMTSSKKKLSQLDKVIKYISNISYEIYLVQYPVIFLLQDTALKPYFKIPLIIIIIFIISSLIHYTIDLSKDNDKYRVFKIIGCIIILIPSLYGIYKFIIAKDHTAEMHALEEKLTENQTLIKEKQIEYEKNLKENNAKWEEALANFDNEEANLKEFITNLPIVGVGDSIMLGAINNLYNEFPNGYFDAAISRTDWEANSVLLNLKSKNLLGDVIIFNLGTNGECPEECKREIFETVGPRKLFWVNATKPDYPIFNTNLKHMAETHKNIHIVDWISASNGHPEYFIADGIHLTQAGGVAYAKTIYNTIYNVYLDELNKQKEAKIKEHELAENNKITFIGNDLLLNAYKYLQTNYSSSDFTIDKTFTYDSLKEIINQKLNDKTLSHNVIFLLDNNAKITKDDYLSLIKLCNEHNIYIVAMNSNLNIDKDNVTILDFYKEIKSNNNYLMIDGIHLTNEGNIALVNVITDNFNEQ